MDQRTRNVSSGSEQSLRKGISPSSELELRSRYCRVVVEKLQKMASGMWPEKLFSPRLKYTIVRMRVSSTGIGPSRLLPEKSRELRLERLPSSGGSLPVNAFMDMASTVRRERLPSSGGTRPVRRFPERLSTLRWERLARAGETSPESFCLLSVRFTTRRVAVSQATPVQLHTSCGAPQLSRAPLGSLDTPDLKDRSAARSSSNVPAAAGIGPCGRKRRTEKVKMMTADIGAIAMGALGAGLRRRSAIAQDIGETDTCW